MAIEDNLVAIKNAVKGKEVRQAIHDGIEQCYKDGKAGAIDLQARQEIATKPSIDDSNIKISDTYSSSKIEELITNSNYKKAVLKQVITAGMNGGTVYISQIANIVFIDFKGCIITGNLTNYTWFTYSSEIPAALYNVYQKISNIAITITENTREVKVTATGGHITGTIIFLVTSTNEYTDETINAIQTSIATANADIEQINKDLSDYFNNNIEINEWFENEYVKYDGTIESYKGWHRTGYVEIPMEVTKIKPICEGISDENSRYNIFFDENKNFVSRAYLNKENVVPYNAKYVMFSCNSSFNVICEKITEEIEVLKANKDVEIALLQSTAKRQKDTNSIFSMLHFTDIHGNQELFDRIVEFSNYYVSNLNIMLHTGDYVCKGQADFIDLMKKAEINNVPLYNVIGNHDQYLSDDDRSQADKSLTYQNVITRTQRAWQSIGATYMSENNSMTYYKDFKSAKIRLIILDDYYDIATQETWLKDVLKDARVSGYHVITAKHNKTDNITNRVTNFNSKDVYSGTYNTTFDAVIKEFVEAGGIHICNICGHEHVDETGYTTSGLLNVVAECATSDVIWQNCKRDKGTRAFDCFNIISVDTNIGLIKIVRIGDNNDIYLRNKSYTCIDYINKKVVA